MQQKLWEKRMMSKKERLQKVLIHLYSAIRA